MARRLGKAAGRSVLDDLTAAERNVLITKSGKCDVEAAPLDTLALPAGQGRLVESFYWALADVRAEHALRLSAAYAKCMAAAGTPAESLGDARQRVERRFATAGPAGGAAWKRLPRTR
ncbi:hypothetical protein ACGFJ7_22505 [Actinoplanes sp. NPDC048988]|uniref:hypothetical protein n=1 Tax=Actinoplanes sp. NPDC048988 TaxID=3363901 RepID=UPI00371764FD